MATERFAQVVVDLPLPHLDRIFDYQISENQIGKVKFGVRVRVPFRNRRIDGFVVGLSSEPSISGKILPIDTLVSEEIVLTPEIYEISKQVAHRNVGNVFDVLRAAVPPRHARAEKKTFDSSDCNEPPSAIDHSTSEGAFEKFFLDRESKLGVLNLAISKSPLEIVDRTISMGVKRAIFVFPDQYDVQEILNSFDETQQKKFAVLTSQQSAEQRYSEFRRTLSGAVDYVIGTRSAVFAPIKEPELIVIFDDGDDLLTSPQAPYWNARQVALVRMEIQGVKLILCSRAQSIEAANLVRQNLASEITEEAPIADSRFHIVAESGDDRSSFQEFHRMPSLVFQTIRKGLESGIVLISVPRKGYQPLVACQDCREILRCPTCHGAFTVTDRDSVSKCMRCNTITAKIKCQLCGSEKHRALIAGAERTAEEIGKAFPGVQVRHLDAENRYVIEDQKPQILVALPGTEPDLVFDAIVVLDSYLFLARPEGNSRIRFIRHLLNLKHRLSKAGRMVVVGDVSNSVLQAALRNDPARVAQDLLMERIETRLSPFARTAQILGDWSAIEELKSILPAHAQIWGPTTTSKDMQEKHAAMALISMPRRESELLVRSIRTWVVNRSANRRSAVVVKIDPDTL